MAVRGASMTARTRALTVPPLQEAAFVVVPTRAKRLYNLDASTYSIPPTRSGVRARTT
jgi:hypothetical protein